ncbi:MAG: type III pantothenate kinase [Anaerosomatales bacterium]|nr:type III pantothenate kinase [Anaerosomatales bacterium]MDT8434272.1 type III pantothenate kinase [Anaerosomatales bacterium]
MILAVDVGNTHTVLGLFDESGLDGHWRVSSNQALTSDELGVKVAGLLAADGHSWDDIEHVVLCSVVPRLTAAYEEIAERACGRAAMVVGPGLKTGIPIRYDNPHEVGADRIVNGVAAYETQGGPVVVVDFGTATTIDVIDASGAYLGGAIAPGVETSAEALFSKAARIAKVDLEAPLKVIGTNTRESVQAGLLIGEAVMVDGLVRRVWAELGTETPVVATGGLAESMAPLCETITAVDVDLTLEGLMIVYQRNV